MGQNNRKALKGYELQAEFYALLTAVCWAVGSLMEKTGIGLGNMTPLTGTVIRTFFSLIFLSVLAFPYLGEIRSAGVKPVVLVAVGGGILAGGLGIVFLYSGLKSGHLSTVMTIAFCLTPVIGVLLGVLVLKEKLTPLQLAGIVICITGAAMTVYFRNPQAA